MFWKRETEVCGSKRFVACLAGAILATSFAGSALAATTVKVTLSDKGADAVMATGLGMGMQGADMTKATMAVTAVPSTVVEGPVTFEVSNTSKDTVHEMIVAPLTANATPLPYDDKNGGVDENVIGALGEVDERDPGATGSVTLDLKPGKYILFCNVPGHYMDGMWSTLTVEPAPVLTQ